MGDFLYFPLGSIELGVKCLYVNSRLKLSFEVKVPEDKTFYHRLKGKPYKPFIGEYTVRNPENFYVALRALLSRDVSYSYNEFNNQDGKGSKTFRILYNKPSVRSAYGIIKDYLQHLNGSQSLFLDEIKDLVEVFAGEGSEEYKLFAGNYKRYVTRANFRQFSKFSLDSYKVINGYSPEQFSFKEILSAFYPYQQVILEFMHNLGEPRYSLVYLDYFLLDAVRQKIEDTLETVESRISSIYGIRKDDKFPLPVLVLEKERGVRNISILPFGVKASLDSNDFLILRKALDYYINTGVTPRFVSRSESGLSIMGGKESLVLSLGGKFFGIANRDVAARILFNLL